MKKNLLIALSVLMIASIALTACGAAATPEPVTIAFWEQEGDDVDVFIDSLIAEFQTANPNITVERTHYENEALRDQFQTASLANAAPDVVRVPNDFAGPFSKLDIVAPVDQLFDDAFLNQFFEGALGPAVVGGTQWGVPDNYGNHLMLIYNKDLIAEFPPLLTN